MVKSLLEDGGIKKHIADFSSEKFIKLTRIKSSSGLLLLLLPILSIIVLGAKDLASILIYIPVFSIGAVLMRSAGCVINDMFDAEIDSMVERTKHRPLASKEATIQDAWLSLIILLSLASILLFALPFKAIVIGIFSLIPITLYPYMKRIIKSPQYFLGFTFNLGIFMAWYTVSDPNSSKGYVPFIFYIAAVLWTIGYDTIYGMQDKKDDEKIGVNSTARLFGDAAPEIIGNMYTIALLLICIAGMNCGVNLLFYLGIGVMAYQMNWQAKTLDVSDVENCKKRFDSNVQAGFILLISALIGKL